MDSTLKYFRRNISHKGWEKFLFFCITKQKPMISADLDEAIRQRIRFGTVDGTTINSQQAEEIQTLYTGGMMNLFFVCGDMTLKEFNNKAAPLKLLSDLKSVGAGMSLQSYYFCMLDQDAESVEAQKSFLTGMRDQWNGKNVYPYLISRKRDDATIEKEASVWRAVMSEILMISAGRRAMIDGRAYSLGYTSLNADERELVELRVQELYNHLQNRVQVKMDRAEAWALLAQDSPLPMDERTTDEQAEKILIRLLKTQYKAPTTKQKENFRILAAIEDQTDMSEIENAVRDFYMMNTRVTMNGLQPVCRQYVLELREKMRRMLNLWSFPADQLQAFADSLKRISGSRERSTNIMKPSMPQPPKLGFLGGGRQKYNLECCEKWEEYYSQFCLNMNVPLAARVLLDEIRQLKDFIEQARGLPDLVSGQKIQDTEYRELADKYPKYDESIRQAIRISESQIFRDVACYHPVSGETDTEAIRAAVNDADETVLSRMPFGYSSTFMDAIQTEFNSVELLDGFLNKNLATVRRMFYCPQDISPNLSRQFLVDEKLNNDDWVRAHKDEMIPVNSDNVERTDLFELQHDINWLLTEGNCVYFTPGIGPVFTCTAVNPFDDADIRPETPVFDPKPDDGITYGEQEDAKSQVVPDRDNQNPRHIALNPTTYDLTWDWDKTTTTVFVCVNTAIPEMCTSTQYNMAHSFNIKHLLKPGKNSILLKKAGGVPYSYCEVSGPMKPVGYSTAGGVLRLEHVDRGIVRMFVVVERYANGVVYYPLCACNAKQRDPYVYRGMNLGGGFSVENRPDQRFPTYRPESNLRI